MLPVPPMDFFGSGDVAGLQVDYLFDAFRDAAAPAAAAFAAASSSVGSMDSS